MNKIKFLIIEDYIELSKEQRQAHLKLDDPCIKIGGESADFRGLLCFTVKTTLPKNGKKIHLCHACHDSSCGNPYHMYWGKPKENSWDTRNNPNKKYTGGFNGVREKFGEEAMMAIIRKGAKKIGDIRRGKPLPEQHVINLRIAKDKIRKPKKPLLSPEERKNRQGVNKGSCWIFLGNTIRKRISKDLLDQYLDKGWSKGYLQIRNNDYVSPDASNVERGNG
jgi:hypothetical protein